MEYLYYRKSSEKGSDNLICKEAVAERIRIHSQVINETYSGLLREKIMSIFTKIEQKYNWKLKEAPIPLKGGFMHKMYKLETDQGVYALKLLNRFIMQRETVMANYAEAERLERLLEQKQIPILPALTFGERKMQELDGEYFYLFDYYAGKALSGKEITEYHCMEIGKVLAKIHSIDKKSADGNFDEMAIDWDFYLTETEKVNRRLYEELKENADLILKSQNHGNRARKKLPGILAVCHNDMDCKNVLWNEKDYRIIDLECLSYNNPMTELFELALCWSGYEECKIDFGLFQAFLRGYADWGGELPADWETLYDCNNGRLEWLEYNLKRVLGIECGEEERELGLEQVKETIRHIIYYDQMRDPILKHCRL